MGAASYRIGGTRPADAVSASTSLVAGALLRRALGLALRHAAGDLPVLELEDRVLRVVAAGGELHRQRRTGLEGALGTELPQRVELALLDLLVLDLLGLERAAVALAARGDGPAALEALEQERHGGRLRAGHAPRRHD